MPVLVPVSCAHGLGVEGLGEGGVGGEELRTRGKVRVKGE